MNEKDKELCEWLRANSGKPHGKCKEAAARIEALCEWINDTAAFFDVCTNNILGTICEGCKCGKKDKNNRF